MADNYLERRMEDLKAGRLSATPRSASARPRKGTIGFAFPPRRVLIAASPDDTILEIIRNYQKAECRTALFDTDKDGGEALAYREGIRFSLVDRDDAEALRTALADLLKAWRGIDIVVTDARAARCREVLEEHLHSHHLRYPIPTDYACRLITLHPDTQQKPADMARNCMFLSLPGNERMQINTSGTGENPTPTAESHEII